MAEARHPQSVTRKGPALIVAHEDPDYAATVCRHFRQLGWHAEQADSVSDVRRLGRESHQATLVLSAEFPGESGWLTCAKLLQERPLLKVILVTDQRTTDNCQFASFVGSAALVEKSTGIRGLIEQVYRVTDLHAAG